MYPNQESPQNKSRIVVHPPDDLPYKVVAGYLDNSRKGLQSLQDAIDRLDYDFVAVYSHRMKGSGGAYGFPQLTEIAASMEDAARARNGDAMRNGAAALDGHLKSIELVEAREGFRM